MSTPVIPEPRAKVTRSNQMPGGINTEMFAWLFMRSSGWAAASQTMPTECAPLASGISHTQ